MSHESYARLSLTKPVGQIQGSHSNPFLNKGVTLAVFQRQGNFPLEKGRLIILAILGATEVAEERKRRARTMVREPNRQMRDWDGNNAAQPRVKQCNKVENKQNVQQVKGNYNTQPKFVKVKDTERLLSLQDNLVKPLW